MDLDDRQVSEIVSRVVERLREKGVVRPQHAPRISHDDPPILRKRAPFAPPAAPAQAAPAAVIRPAPGEGLYDDVDAACRAAERSFIELSRLGFNARFKIVDAMRKCALENLERWSHEAAQETGMGRVPDKIMKNRLVATRTPGPEILQKPETFNGSDGLTLIRLEPFGVLASVIPCTNSTETVINNGISMVSSGNSVVFNAHPVARNVSAGAVRALNRAIASAGGPRELLCCILEPTIESANALMRHPLTALVLVTGGGAVVKAAFESGKRAVCAGPGNPPAVVDETANLEDAAQSIVLGGSLDNNVVCTDEKAILAVDSIADKLKALLLKNGCVEVSGRDAERLTDLVLAEKGGPGKYGMTNKKFVGKNPSVILREIGMQVGDDVRLALVDVDKNHPLVFTEQLMPVMPLCRLKDAGEAIAHAAAVEAGRRHTASIHSNRTDRITEFANTLKCSICVVNDANYAGLGMNGEGYTSFSIATPTGEGMTTARTFCRERRLAICRGGLGQGE